MVPTVFFISTQSRLVFRSRTEGRLPTARSWKLEMNSSTLTGPPFTAADRKPSSSSRARTGYWSSQWGGKHRNISTPCFCGMKTKDEHLCLSCCWLEFRFSSHIGCHGKWKMKEWNVLISCCWLVQKVKLCFPSLYTLSQCFGSRTETNSRNISTVWNKFHLAS